VWAKSTHPNLQNDQMCRTRLQIDAAVESKALPKRAAKQLKLFLTAGCSPLPAGFNDALDTILPAMGKFQLFFQAIVLPGDFFDVTGTDTSDQETNKKSVFIVGIGTKVAEGGRLYDELVCRIILVSCI
jgi:hypothetical protein